MPSTRIAAAQISAELGQLDSNLSRVLDVIHDAKAHDVDLVVFPEAILSGYHFDNAEAVRENAVSLAGQEVAAIIAAAHATGVIIVLGFIELDGDEIYNTAALIGTDGLIGTYRKQHLPFLGLDRFVRRGSEEAPAVFDTPIGRVGLAICYDVRFPESARGLALAKADLIAQPSVWPDSAEIISEHIVRVRAAENHVFLVAVSRGDIEAGNQYRGRSQIVDPTGRILAQADKADNLITADVDLTASSQKNIIVKAGEYELHLFADRRPELYGNLTAAHRA
jgi:5-aminopentanamidase